MCTTNTEVKFCSCIEGDISEVKNIYIWTLRSYIGSKEFNIRGKIIVPIKNLVNGISVESIIARLNTGNIFDFEYIPKEREPLHISLNKENREEYKYFTLIFKEKIWQEGSNPVFVSINKSITEGEIIIKESL